MNIDEQIARAWDRTYIASGSFHAKNISLSGMSARDRFESGYRAAVSDMAAKVAALEAFARDCRDNWDCDSDSHKYGTPCRACEAAKVIGNHATQEATDGPSER